MKGEKKERLGKGRVTITAKYVAHAREMFSRDSYGRAFPWER